MTQSHLSKIDLFSRNTKGFHNYRIPALCITKKGTLLATCEARKWASDWSCEAIVIRKSYDGGATWSAQENLISSPVPISPGKNTKEALNNPLFIVDSSNTIHFLYAKYYKQVFYMKSTDDGRTFSPPREISHVFDKFRTNDGYNWNVIATGPGNGIQMKSGRLVVPIWLSYGKGKSHGPNICGVIFSDNLGESWQAGDLVSNDYFDTFGQLNENQPIQLHDGKVLLNIRSGGKRLKRVYSVSEDGAHNWSPPQFVEDIFDPICMAGIARVSEKGIQNQVKNRIIFSNPTGGRSWFLNKQKRSRENLGIRLSYDEGKSWPILKILENSKSGYSDLAISPTGEIFCLYERAKSNPIKKLNSYYDRISIAKFNLEWLTDNTDNL